MLHIYRDRTQATCVEDLSHLEGKVFSDMYEEKFPLIGRTYSVEKILLINELRDDKGRCIPRRGINSSQDLIRIHLKSWHTEEDMFGEEEGFQSGFICFENEDFAYSYLKQKGINIRQIGWQDKRDEGYKKGWWKRPPTPERLIKLEQSIRRKVDTSPIDRMIYFESKRGGHFFDKPYYGLPVINERVIEDGRVTIIKPERKIEPVKTTGKIFEENIDIDFDNF